MDMLGHFTFTGGDHSPPDRLSGSLRTVVRNPTILKPRNTMVLGSGAVLGAVTST